MPRRRRTSDGLVDHNPRQRGSLTRLFAGVRDAIFSEDRGAAGSRSVVARAARFGVEPLEQRVMLHSIGFGTDFFGQNSQADGTFEFIQGNPKQTIRVVWHDLTAELIPVEVDDSTGTQPDVPRVPTPADAVPDLLPAQASPPTNVPNLFTIYITHSTTSSWLSIAEVADVNTTGAPRPMIPYSGTAGPFAINNAGPPSNTPITFSPGDGSALLGAKFTAKADKDIPVFDVPITGSFGIFPGSPTGRLRPGVIMAPVDTVGDGINPPPNTPNDIGSFFFGGTITGEVNIPSAPAGTATAPSSSGGNVGVFYAGSLLTGDASGIFQGGGLAASSLTSNFTVGGDIRTLVVGNAFGGDIDGGTQANPRYITGFRAVVGGTVGQVVTRSGEMFGSIQIAHDPSVYGLPANLFTDYELEFKPGQGDNVGNVFQGNIEIDPTTGLPLGPRLSIFTNDTPATAQFLNPVRSVDPFTGLPLTDVSGQPLYVADVTGIFQGARPAAETDDYYAIAMMAGQSLTITANTSLSAQIQVLDPDQRIIATDENQAHPAQTVDQPFGVTADRPGIYYIRVTNPPNILDRFDFSYTLHIEGVGNLGLGAVAATGGEIFDAGYDKQIEVTRGDLGAVVAGTNVLSTSLGQAVLNPGGTTFTQTPPEMIAVTFGNLITIQAPSIGLLVSQATNNPDGTVTAAAFGDIPSIAVPSGSVGLVSGTDPAGITALETPFDLFTVNKPTTPIGGSFQIISGAGPLFLEIAANAGIGTIRAGDMATSPSFIEVNADNVGQDGIIDLVDCTGAFGILGGGPEFVTNQGGDIRYMHLGGIAFKDQFFGGTRIDPTLFPVAQAVQFTDDSGTPVNITPTGPIVDTVVTNPDGTTTTTTTGPQISVQAYPIRDKGGEVPFNITSTGGMTISASGVAGNQGRVEFGTLNVVGNATGIAAGPVDSNGNTTIIVAPLLTTGGVTPPTTPTTPVVDQSLTISGPARVDVFSTVATGNITTIANNTTGEMVNVTASNVGTLSAKGDIGLATPVATPAAVLPGTVAANTYPLIGERIPGVQVAFSIVTLTAGGSIGNVSVFQNSAVLTDGTIGTLIANADGVTQPGDFDGIVGNVVATRLLNVSIGDGIAFSGSGTVSFAGLYVTDKIGTLTSPQVTYIRGNVISLEAAPAGFDPAVTVVRGIDVININGSIIGADVGTYTTFIQAQAINFRSIIPVVPHVAGEFDIGAINVNGRGGILGALIHAYNIGPVTVGRAGFGVLQTVFGSVANGRIGNITAGGYGIRDVLISGGDTLNALIANGNGATLPVADFPAQLRASEFSPTRDPFTHSVPTINTDLNIALGVSPGAASADAIDTGVIEDVEAEGGGDFGTLVAQKVRTALPVFTPITQPATPTANIPVVGTTFTMALNFANSVAAIRVARVIDGLQITTGRLGTFAQSGSVSRLGVSVAGTINSFMIHGNLGQTITDPATGNPIPDSYVQATGPNGSITAMGVSGSLFANVTANISIGNMYVGHDVLGSITASGQTKGLTLGNLRVGGAIRDGALTIDGNAGNIITNFGLGSDTGSLTVNGNINVLNVGATHTRTDSNLRLNLHVTGQMNTLMVYGAVTGTVTVDGDLNKMVVVSPIHGANAVTGAVTIGGRLGSAAVANGNVAANVSVSGPVTQFLVNRGSVLSNATISSNVAGFGSFRIIGGKAFGLFGNLLQPQGGNTSISISGDIGDGTDPVNITAFSGSVIQVIGSIQTGVNIAIADALNLLQVQGSIEAGATISAHPLKKIVVVGSNNGTITSV